MGEKGVVTRILASKYGGFLTFGALSSGQESAPGQPTVKDLIDLYRIREHSAATKVFGIIGNPVKHSRSPVLHNRAMASASFDGVYVPLLVDNMDTFMSTFSEFDWAGYSVTIPHKVNLSYFCIRPLLVVIPCTSFSNSAGRGASPDMSMSRKQMIGKPTTASFMLQRG
jgi:hypothetical protein